MNAWTVTVLVTLIAFAGCLGGKDPAVSTTSAAPTTTSAPTTSVPPTTTSAPPTTTSSPPPTTTPPSSENRAPTATLNATIDALNVTFNMTGNDQDNDPLSWTLSFGDNSNDASGSSLPASLNHSYAAAGSYSAILTVSDAEDATIANFTVVLGASSGQIVATEWAVGSCAIFPVVEDEMPTSGVAYGEFHVDEATIGAPWTVTFTYAEGGVQGRVAFYDGEHALIGVPEISEPAATTLEGTVPEGAHLAIIYSCGLPTGGSAVYMAG